MILETCRMFQWSNWNQIYLNFSQDHFLKNLLQLIQQTITIWKYDYFHNNKTSRLITTAYIMITWQLHALSKWWPMNLQKLDITNWTLAVWLWSETSLPFSSPHLRRKAEAGRLPFQVPTWRSMREGERQQESADLGGGDQSADVSHPDKANPIACEQELSKADWLFACLN